MQRAHGHPPHMHRERDTSPNISVSALDLKEGRLESINAGHHREADAAYRSGNAPTMPKLVAPSDNEREYDDNVQFRDEGDASSSAGAAGGYGRGGTGQHNVPRHHPRPSSSQSFPPQHQQQQYHGFQQQQQQQLPPFQYQQPSLQQQQLWHHQQQQQQQQLQNPGTPAQYPPPDSSAYSQFGAAAYSDTGGQQQQSSSSDFNRDLPRHPSSGSTSGGGGATGLRSGVGGTIISQHATMTPVGTAGAMGGFGTMGQTPMTGASFGSSAGMPTPQHSRGGGGGVGEILRASNYYPGMETMQGGGAGQMEASGLLRGNDPLQPTPVVRRGGQAAQPQSHGMQQQQQMMQGTPSPGMHYHQTGMMQSEIRTGQHPSQQQQQGQLGSISSQQGHASSSGHNATSQHRSKRKLDPIDEEDPAMLRYESSVLTSPMVGERGLEEPPMQRRRSEPKREATSAVATGETAGMSQGGRRDSSESMQRQDPKSDDDPASSSRGGYPQDRREPGSSQHSQGYSQDPQDPSRMSSSSSGNVVPGELQRVASGQSQGSHPSQRGQQACIPAGGADNPTSSVAVATGGGPVLNEFPFFFDGYAAWVCRHCQHIPPYYRGGNYVWQASNPPPNQFVDLHLRFCPGLNPGNMPPPAGSGQRAQREFAQQQQYRMQQAGFGMQGGGMQEGAQGAGGFSYPVQQTMHHQQQIGQNAFAQQQQHQGQLHHHEQTQGSYSRQSSGSGLPPQQQEEQSSKDEQGAAARDPPGLRSPKPPAGKQERTSKGTEGDDRGENVASKDLVAQGEGVASRELVPMMAAAGGGPQGGGYQWDYPPGGRPPHSYQVQQPHHQYNPYQQHHLSGGYPSQMIHMPGGPGGIVGMHAYHQHMPMQPPMPVAARGVGEPNASSPPPNKSNKRKPSSTKISPKGRRTDDVTYGAAADFLAERTVAMALPPTADTDVGQSLIDRSDADLLTDYFFHMMQQLVVCRFSEKDRKTRGGKRENINIGYGGLQCIHCIVAPSARKFFWSTVDRLANSFAEIPSHVLKCKHCPDDVKDALLALKGRHPDQMQMLPRGSQKVFFRRMWRRLHDGDSKAATPVREQSLSEERGLDPPSSSLKSPKISANSAASALAKSAKKAVKIKAEEGVGVRRSDSSEGSDSTPEDQRTRVLLAIPEDKDWLSDMDCFVRNQIEVFSSKLIDVENAVADRKYPIKVGQVGIRCVHCAGAKGGARVAAVCYPYSISGIYESVREFQRLHLDNCQNIPKDLKDASDKLGSGAASLSSVLRRYYVQAARALGLHDTHDTGIRAGGKPVPMSTAGFQSPASTFRPAARDAPGTMPDEDRKRKQTSPAEEEGGDERETKRAKAGSEDAPAKDTDSPKHQRDAPAKNDVLGQEDAPGTRADEGAYEVDAPGGKAESLAHV